MSTGPKSAAGKALVRLNSVAHGIYSVSPVIEELESRRSWSAYRCAMLDNLAPVGMVEQTLAERIILMAWRLRRVARFEVEQIRLEQEDVLDEVNRRLKYRPDWQGESVEQIFNGVRWRKGLCQSISVLLTGNDDDLLSEDDAANLLYLTHDELGQAGQFDTYFKQFSAGEPWKVAKIRQNVRALCEQHRKQFDELLGKIEDQANADLAHSEETANEAQTLINKFQREHLLPDTEALEKIQRYESHLSRQFHRSLHELQRLQAMRLGHPVAAPISIDVDVAPS